MPPCPTCGATNRPGAAFCRHCGRLLIDACPRCRSAAAPGANFCDACGGPLSPAAWTGLPNTRYEIRDTSGVTSDERRVTSEEGRGAGGGWQVAGSERPVPHSPNLPVSQSPVSNLPIAQSPVPQSPVSNLQSLDRYIPRELLDKLSAARGAAAERRVVTMLFCDIQGSTALAEAHDPEEWTEIVNAAFEQMVRPIYKYEGTVARLMGDGLLAFFGAPIAHEDDPRRAILAGLTIIDGLRAWRDSLPPAYAALDVRVGINTGLVVVGAVGSDLRLEYSAIGDAINLAARMEQTAAPGTVQIAEETYRLVADQFEVEALGGIAVKGKAQPVNAYRVLRRAGDARRAAGAFRAPLVNRRMEWDTLERAFDALGAGRGGIVFLTGDAGLGKTRLIDEAAERLLPTLNPPGRLYDASAVSYETNQPYGLLVRQLRRPFGLLSGDPAERIREHITAAVPMDEDRALMEALYGVAGDSGHELTGEAFAAQLDACLARIWRGQAAAGPVVLALDDLQWLDASSAERLARLVRLTDDTPILFLCAMRRDRRSPAWGLKETVARELPHRQSEVALHPLNDGESRALLAGLLGAADPPDALAALILDKAEGNPLFLEEVVRHLIERGELRGEEGNWEVAPTTISLPDSLQALLTARIDRLDEATRRTLQVASVIGRHFWHSPLAALVDDSDALDARLLDLQRLELIREVGRVPEPNYLFNHSLTQEAVYNTILLRQRRALHLRVAEVIEQLRAGATAGVAALLAHHFIEGEAPRRALPYLLQAADSALRLHAVHEALAAYDRARPIATATAAVADAPAAPAATADLIAIYTGHGRALELLSRFAEAKAAYEEMEQLALARGDTKLELEAVIAQGKLYANVNPFYDSARGRALMERAVALAEAAGDAVAEVRILWNLVNLDRFDLNSLERAVANGERGLALARELGLEEELAYLLNDLGELYGTLGRLERAGELLAEARQKWRELGNEAMLADSLTSAAVWEQIRGRLHDGLAKTEEAYAITTRIGNIWGEAYSLAVRGQILGWLGEFGRAVEDLTDGHAKTIRAGFVAGQILSANFLARVLQEMGDLDGALGYARPALQLAREQVPQFAGLCAGRIVNCLVEKGEVAAAAALFADPLVLQERQQIFQLFDVTLAAIKLHLAQGETDAAIERAAAAVALFTEIGSASMLPDVYLAGAAALRAAGRLDEAGDYLAAAVVVGRQLGGHGLQWRYLAAAANLAAERGDRASAARLRAEAAAEIDALAGRIYPDGLRASFLAQPDVRRIREFTDFTDDTD